MTHWHSTLNQLCEPGNALKPRTCRNTPNTGASCFLKAHSSARTGAEQPELSALRSLVTEVNITLAPGSASSPHNTTASKGSTLPPPAATARASRASGPKPLRQACVLPCDPHSLFCCITGRKRELLSRMVHRKHLYKATPSKEIQTHISAQGMASQLHSLPTETKFN